MKAVQLTGLNGLDSLKVVEVDRPKPQAHELPIKVEAAGIKGRAGSSDLSGNAVNQDLGNLNSLRHSETEARFWFVRFVRDALY